MNREHDTIEEGHPACQGFLYLPFSTRLNDLRTGQVSQILIDCTQFFTIHFSNRTPRHLFAKFMAARGRFAAPDNPARGTCIMKYDANESSF